MQRPALGDQLNNSATLAIHSTTLASLLQFIDSTHRLQIPSDRGKN